MNNSSKQNQVSIDEVQSRKDMIEVEKLAIQIWTQHYTPIIGSGQVEYMLNKFQSLEAIEKQISEGMAYYLLRFDNDPVGYLACKADGEELFLSKIYVLSELRGRGIGSEAMNFLTSKGLSEGRTCLSLTVNKENTASIGAYEKLGFVNMGPLETDIGSGYVMDDFLMKKSLN